MRYKNKKILITTGGTGGHIFPAYSLAKHLMKKESLVEIMTDKRGFKYLKKFKELNIILNNFSSIYKGNKLNKVLSVFIIIFSFLKSLLILFKKRPFLVFGMGGYSSFPVCIAAKVLKIPFIIYENNLLIGKSNKYLLPFAYKLFVAYPELEGVNDKYKKKLIRIGNIIREEILNQNTLKKKESFGKKSFTILILGGSQAAKSFGEKLPLIFEKCILDNLNIKLYQQCVPSQNEKLTKLYKSLNIEFELFNFTDNILNYISKADLAITRSGSSMIAELLNCKIPFVAIPYPYAADNHQEKNAIYFKNRGYGFLINEKEISSELFPLIKEIYRDKKILKQISDKQSTHSDKKVFEKIDNEILNLFND
tara:strand:- start:401 stop:1498 length:1098 start_codon:yes stop_codon:yes gene_type:complete